MFQPNSGLVSNHESCSRSWTVEPTTASDGNSTLAEVIRPTTSPSVLVWVRWVMVVPRSVSDTGVPSSRPAASRSPSALASVSGVPSTTTVTLSAVEQVQSTLVPPLTTCSDGEAADVSGTPAYVGTALTALTPGTISNLIPALWHAIASSARPLNIAGSPSMSLTTSPLPSSAPAALAALTNSFARDAWVSG